MQTIVLTRYHCILSGRICMHILKGNKNAPNCFIITVHMSYEKPENHKVKYSIQCTDDDDTLDSEVNPFITATSQNTHTVSYDPELLRQLRYHRHHDYHQPEDPEQATTTNLCVQHSQNLSPQNNDFYSNVQPQLLQSNLAGCKPDAQFIPRIEPPSHTSSENNYVQNVNDNSLTQVNKDTTSGEPRLSHENIVEEPTVSGWSSIITNQWESSMHDSKLPNLPIFIDENPTTSPGNFENFQKTFKTNDMVNQHNTLFHRDNQPVAIEDDISYPYSFNDVNSPLGEQSQLPGEITYNIQTEQNNSMEENDRSDAERINVNFKTPGSLSSLTHLHSNNNTIINCSERNAAVNPPSVPPVQIPLSNNDLVESGDSESDSGDDSNDSSSDHDRNDQCIGPVCFNKGQPDLNMLCQWCFDTLASANTTGRSSGGNSSLSLRPNHCRGPHCRGKGKGSMKGLCMSCFACLSTAKAKINSKDQLKPLSRRLEDISAQYRPSPDIPWSVYYRSKLPQKKYLISRKNNSDENSREHGTGCDRSKHGQSQDRVSAEREHNNRVLSVSGVPEKCKQVHCDNYGNSRCNGYCYGCFQLILQDIL